jgi:hypothetical protein
MAARRVRPFATISSLWKLSVERTSARRYGCTKDEAERQMNDYFGRL